MRSSREWLGRELTAFASGLQEGVRVLDAGSGDQRYAEIFHKQLYESADFEKVDKEYVKPTYVCDLAQIPVVDQHYDVVVFTQVMEHLPEPLIVLKEFHRILKPDGVLFFSAPLWYQEHELPYDFYRYTQFGIRHLFGAARFEVHEMRWLEGYMGSVAHQFRLMRKHLPNDAKSYGGGLSGFAASRLFGIFRLALPLLYHVANWADNRHRYTKGGLPKNYVAVLKLTQ